MGRGRITERKAQRGRSRGVWRRYVRVRFGAHAGGRDGDEKRVYQLKCVSIASPFSFACAVVIVQPASPHTLGLEIPLERDKVPAASGPAYRFLRDQASRRQPPTSDARRTIRQTSGKGGRARKPRREKNEAAEEDRTKGGKVREARCWHSGEQDGWSWNGCRRGREPF
jgi:hypothetical protein